MRSSDGGVLFEEEPSEAALSPPLKWAGGKRWLMPILRKLFAPFASRRLVEPFVGGMAVALGLEPRRALLNDINRHLMHFYRWLQRGLVMRIEMRNDRERYYKARERFNELVRGHRASGREASELFYYLNRTCFNGLCRFNSKGEFNVPFGRYSVINYAKHFRPYRALFRKWDFDCVDFEFLKLQRGDFLYSDPPYDVEFTRYAKDDFNWDDQERLADWLHRYKGPIVASNQATNRIIRLYRKYGFHITQIAAPRMIACTGNRDKVAEILAIKGM